MDALNALMKDIDKEYNLGLFDRMKACYLENNEVKTLNLNDFRLAIKNKEVSSEIEVFDFSNFYFSFRKQIRKRDLKSGFKRLLFKEKKSTDVIKF